MTISPFMAAINQIADEKNIPKEQVLETVAAALAVAYRKDYGRPTQSYRVDLSPDTGEIAKIWQVFEVVAEEDLANPEAQLLLADAKKIDKKAEVGGTVEIEKPMPQGFGRIAAQTAKQVIIQRLREAERDVVFKEYKDKEGKVLQGTVQRIEGGNIVIDLGRASAVMFPAEQVQGERYYIGQRLKIFLVRVEETARGPQIVVSRSHPGLVKYVFTVEVPEIEAGAVEIVNIAREPGVRSKVAVRATVEGVDPVGSCVGQRGTRVQAIISELGNEKIDIVLYSDDILKYIENALSPARIARVVPNKEHVQAYIYVMLDQLSLAIGKQGQNVRLASKLTGWKLDIVEASEEVLAKLEKELKEKEKAVAKKKAGKKVKMEEVKGGVEEVLRKVEKKGKGAKGKKKEKGKNVK